MDHPDIEMCERTGYPRGEPKAYIVCGVCGENIYPGEEYYNFDDDIACDDCYRDYINENFRRVAGNDV